MFDEKRHDGTVRAASQDKNKNAPGGLRRNLVPKILCVLAAFVLWLYVMQVESPEYEDVISYIPVQLENATALENNEGLSVYSGSANRVNVRVSGKKSIVSKLTSDDLKAYVDLSTIKDAGRHALDISVDLPDGVTLVEPTPGTVTVYVDETDSISLAVSEKMLNMVLESPYELGEIDFEFDTINVTGPKNRLSLLAGAQVSINMENRKSSFVTTCPITLVDKNGNTVDMDYLSMTEKEMTVTVPICLTKEVPVEVTLKNGLVDPDLVTIKTEPETVTVRGDASNFAEGVSVIEKIEIDEKLIMSTPYTIVLQPIPVPGVTVAPDDSEITVTVEFDSSLRTKQFKVSDIKVTNAQTDLDYEILDESIDVTLRGNVSDLNRIKVSDISAEVDLSGYEPGNSGVISKNVTIIIDAENSDSVFEVGTYTVQVKIN